MIPPWLRIGGPLLIVLAVLATIAGLYGAWQHEARRRAALAVQVDRAVAENAVLTRQNRALEQAATERAADEDAIQHATKKVIDEIHDIPDARPGASTKRLGCLRIEAARGRAAAVSAGC